MKVILLADVHQVGRRGDVVVTKPGHARNYLIPQGYAMQATPAAQKWFEQRRAKIEAQNQLEVDKAALEAARLDGTVIRLAKRAADNATLYGSVTAAEIANGLAAKGFEVDRRRIDLEGGIKTLGEHEVRVTLHAEVIARVTVEVTPEA